MLLEACAHQVPNVAYFIETSPTSGHGFMTMSDKEFDVDNQHLWQDTDGVWKNWAAIKNSALVFPASSYGTIKLFIINECQDAKNCTGLDVPKLVKRLDKAQSYILSHP